MFVLSGNVKAAQEGGATISGSTGPLSPTGMVVLQTMLPNQGAAKELAAHLVGARVAASATIIPSAVTVYTDSGRVVETQEALLSIKTLASSVKTVIQKIKIAHPYDEPEIIALPVVAASSSYVTWVEDSLCAGASQPAAEAPQVPTAGAVVDAAAVAAAAQA